jgi:hypothetical protein
MIIVYGEGGDLLFETASALGKKDIAQPGKASFIRWTIVFKTFCSGSGCNPLFRIVH